MTPFETLNRGGAARAARRAGGLLAGLMLGLMAWPAQAALVLSSPDFPTARTLSDGIRAYQFQMKELHYRPVQKDLVFVNMSAGRTYQSGIVSVDIKTGVRTVLARTCEYPIDPNCDGFVPNQVWRMAVRADGWFVLSIGQNQFTGFPTYITLYQPNGLHNIFTQRDQAPDYLGTMAFDRQDRFSAVHSYSRISRLPPGVVGSAGDWYFHAQLYAFITGSPPFQARAFTYGQPTALLPEGRPFVAMSDGSPTGAGVVYELERGTINVRAGNIPDPRWLAIDPITQDIFVATGTRILRISEEHRMDPPKVIAEGFHKITGLAFDPSGNLYVGDHELGVDQTNPLLHAGEILVLKRAGVQLEVGLIDRNNPPDPERDLISDKVVKDIHLPLGTGFSLRLRDTPLVLGTPGAPMPATYTISQTAVAAMPPLPYGDPLFPFTVALMFTDPGPQESRNFFATHVGTAMVDVVPRDATIKPFKVRINVYPNAAGSLGTVHPEVDLLLSDFGHRRGMPPFMLKGQMANESGFEPSAYRYEPVSQDFYRFSSVAVGPGCQLPGGRRGILSEPRYRAYALGVANLGADVIPQDRTFRPLYQVSDPCTRRPRPGDPRRRLNATPADDQCTSDNIYRTNNPLGERWDTITSACWRNAIAADPALLDFPAQTSLAASYGYFQMLYLSAREIFRWPGVQDANHPTRPGQTVHNPYYLTDTQPNLALGGGTTTLATGYVKSNWVRIHGQGLAQAPVFSSLSAFKQTFTPAFQAFNAHANGYGAHAMRSAERYLPALTLPVF